MGLPEALLRALRDRNSGCHNRNEPTTEAVDQTFWQEYLGQEDSGRVSPRNLPAPNLPANPCLDLQGPVPVLSLSKETCGLWSCGLWSRSLRRSLSGFRFDRPAFVVYPVAP